MIVTLHTLLFLKEPVLAFIGQFIRLFYYKYAVPYISNNELLEDDNEEQVFAEYDDEKGVVFYPPVYAQRYAAVSDCLMDSRWCGKLQKVVDLGYNDMSFIKYLKDIPGIKTILGVDVENVALKCSSDILSSADYCLKRENPLHIVLYQGNAADPDYRLIGCDAVIAIEMIEHMLPHDLERLIHNIFGFIQPWVTVITTPNADFNVLFKSLGANGFRRWDHYFEWTREQFHDWCSNIVQRYPNYTVTCIGVGPGPPDTQHLGCCSQLALFVNKNYHKQEDLTFNSLAFVANCPNWDSLDVLADEFDSNIDDANRPSMEKLNCSMTKITKFSKNTMNILAKNRMDTLAHTREIVKEIKNLKRMLNFDKSAKGTQNCTWNNINWGENAPYWNQYYEVVKEYNYPFEMKSDEQRILELVSDEISRLIDTKCNGDCNVGRIDIPIESLMKVVRHITQDVDRVKDLLEWNGYEIVGNVVIYSRMILYDNYANLTNTDDWQENDLMSDVKEHLNFKAIN